MSFELVSRFGLLILFCTILTVVSNVGTVAACLMIGVKFKKIAVFTGKPVFTFQTAIGQVCIGYIPMGGFVELDMEVFPSKPLLSRCMVTLSGPLAVFLSSLICVGLGDAGSSFASTFPQFVDFVVSPWPQGKEFFQLFLANAQGSPIAGYGVFAAKVAALNLFPVPPLAGGRILIEVTKKRDSSILARALTYAGSIVVFSMLVWMVVAIIKHFCKTHL
jgi:membrane-associated protease RseP (regulator of RpoE activity)